jgi:hypothetical protein
MATLVRPRARTRIARTGRRSGGAQERNLWFDPLGIDVHVPLGASTSDPCREELLQALCCLCLGNRRVGLLEGRRRAPVAYHPDPARALADRLDKVEAHRLVGKYVDRRRARLAGLFRARLRRVERVRLARRTPQELLVGERVVSATDEDVLHVCLPAQHLTEEPVDEFDLTVVEALIRAEIVGRELGVDLPRVVRVTGV